MGKPKNKSRPAKAALATLVAMLLALTPTTAMADMHGIDVSGWQSSTVTCAAPGDFAIVKVTGGTYFTNARWRAQADCTLRSGKALGLYHYANDGAPGDAVAEADRFVSYATPYLGRALLALDWESQGNYAWGNGDWIRRFVNRVHDRTGVWPMVYASASAVWQIPSDVRANCGLWVAQYANMNATGYQSAPWNLGAAGEAMRQYTSSGYVGGVGPLDLNLFRGDRTAWNKYANPTGSGSGGSTSTPSQPSVDLEALAEATIRGDYGNGQQRRDALGANYAAVMAIVNQRLTGSTAGQTQQTTQAATTRVTVRSGDTMSAIATRTGLWPLSAWSVPSGNINRIWPGQVVTYNGGSVSTGSNAPPSRTVTVRSGDTLSGIAARLGISYTQITGYRSGNPNVIYPGEVLSY